MSDMLINILCIAVMVVIIFAAKIKINSLEQEVSIYRESAEANEKALKEAQAELEKVNKVLLEREVKIHEIETRAGELAKRLNNALKEGSPASAWGNSLLPDDIVLLFTDSDKNGDGKIDTADGTSANSADPEMGRANK